MIKYNKLTLISDLGIVKREGYKTIRRRGVFKCECGDVSEYQYCHVKNGTTKSCKKCGYKTTGKKNTKHMLSNDRVYSIYKHMISRCYNNKDTNYKNYGGRGIKVCLDWCLSIDKFNKWCKENGYSNKLTLDRIDVNGNYTPSNCRFVTKKKQSFNRRNTLYALYKGKYYNLCEIYNNNNINKSTLRNGIKNGKDLEYYVNKYNLTLKEEYTKNYLLNKDG